MTSPGGGVNEDAAGWSGDAFWVLDGATPLYGSYRKTAARWLVDTADRLLRRSLARGDPDDASTLLVSLARRLSTELRKANKTGGYGLPSAAVGIVLHRPEAVEYALLGDVTLVVADGSEIRVATDDRVGKLDAEAVALLHRLVTAGATYDEAWPQVLKMLRRNRRTMNVDESYWILGERPVAARRARTGSFAVADGFRLLLATDGFARIVDPLGLYADWEGVLAELAGSSLEPLVTGLREREASDPDCRTYPRLTPSDDATAVYVEKEPLA